jgi:hypothetical protein
MGSILDHGTDRNRDRWVIVPRKAGDRLVPFSDGVERDDVDDLVDELLGEDTTKGASAGDVLLLVGGAGLIGWGVAVEVAVLVVCGVVAMLLGAVLPLRSLWRRLHRKRSERLLARVGGESALLNVAASSTAELAAAYEQVVAHAAPDDDAARQVAHLAVVEVATLLNARQPAGVAELEYVRRRGEALSQLAAVMAARPVRAGNEQLIAARDELDALTGRGSLAQIDALVAQLGTDGG